MKSNYYNFKKYKDKYLLTNEEGKYIFLSEEEFHHLVYREYNKLEEGIFVRLKQNYFIYDEIRDINSWLTAYEFPQKLYINSEYLHDVYFNAIFSNIEFRRINGEIVALTFTVTCDSPYAWEDFSRVYDCSSGETQIT